MGKSFSKSVAEGKGIDKKQFLNDFMSSVHIVSAEELASHRNANYQYIL